MNHWICACACVSVSACGYIHTPVYCVVDAFSRSLSATSIIVFAMSKANTSVNVDREKHKVFVILGYWLLSFGFFSVISIFQI